MIESRANLPAAELWLILRCDLGDPSIIKYNFSNAPAKTPLNEFVRLSGMRSPIEIDNLYLKEVLGLGDFRL